MKQSASAFSLSSHLKGKPSLFVSIHIEMLLRRGEQTFANAISHIRIFVQIPCLIDLDWRWHQYALDKGVMLSINPDAHRNEGFLDMHYGILAARKGGLNKEMCLNALSLEEIKRVFDSKKVKA